MFKLERVRGVAQVIDHCLVTQDLKFKDPSITHTKKIKKWRNEDQLSGHILAKHWEIQTDSKTENETYLELNPLTKSRK
jgi:hypothetical protein